MRIALNRSAVNQGDLSSGQCPLVICPVDTVDFLVRIFTFTNWFVTVIADAHYHAFAECPVEFRNAFRCKNCLLKLTGRILSVRYGFHIGKDIGNRQSESCHRSTYVLCLGAATKGRRQFEQRLVRYGRNIGRLLNSPSQEDVSVGVGHNPINAQLVRLRQECRHDFVDRLTVIVGKVDHIKVGLQ